MSCESCSLAENRPRIYAYTNGCNSCKARALAATGAHLESKECQRLTAQYKAALQTLFGAEWKQGAEQVKAWAERMRSKSAGMMG